MPENTQKEATQEERLRREETLAEMGAHSATRPGSQPSQDAGDVPGKPEPPHGDLPEGARGALDDQTETSALGKRAAGPEGETRSPGKEHPVDPGGPRPPLWE